MLYRKPPLLAQPTMADWIDHIASVGIYPPIGIARVGNSTEPNIGDGWYYGPEVPGRYDEPPGGFKDTTGAVKRQAARFRVFAFDANKTVLGEVNANNGFTLDWTVRVANKKASWYAFMGKCSIKLVHSNQVMQPFATQIYNLMYLLPDDRHLLIVDSGEQKINKVNQAPVPLAGQFFGSKDTGTDVYLGEARSDEEGRLVVLAGRGLSFSIATEGIKYPLILTDFDSPDWIDDTSDGWISVKVTHLPTAKSFSPSTRARVIGTTPKFANGIYAPTTLYDVMEEIYEQPKRTAAGAAYDVGPVDWYKDIWPLLVRPPLLSWVNGQANGGHGPNGPGNFYDPKWQEVLSDSSEDNKPQRKGILGRMRLPETNAKYDKARGGQAFPYFMPWLSGDGGRATPGDPTTFSSITELQYDRLVKWSDGYFTSNTSCKCGSLCQCSPPGDIEEVPLQDRPGQLTKASLEATIGAPLYPGIELSWNAEVSETYNLESPFTINEDVKQGDLTKYLSLPWQSDFYMCRSYWWPSARPDAIVSEVDYKRLQKAFQPSDLAKGLTKRVPWERGIHQNYTGMLFV
ncbi:hypothetical protein BDN70DRAFT_954169 [Pholiota conissans]|uniref:L-lysine 6-oxidase n=1 Tax=Pholiota conissans TaxID=109636 RepID=A0A9P5ZC34_9AGAR|nr:hypothetical protein BDN70DRAFT_954169 [Pholiota conissans]